MYNNHYEIPLTMSRRYLIPNRFPYAWMNSNHSDELPLDTIVTFLVNHFPALNDHFLFLAV